MTAKQAFPVRVAQVVAAGFRWLNITEPIKVKDFRSGRHLSVRTEVELQNSSGDVIRVPVRFVASFGRPQPL